MDKVIAIMLAMCLLVVSCGAGGSVVGRRPTLTPDHTTTVPPNTSVNSNDTPIPGPTTPPDRPKAIAALAPRRGTDVCPRPLIHVGIHINDSMLRDGNVKVDQFSLRLDDRDITSETELSIAASYPPDAADFEYLPDAPLSLGSHRVVVSMPAVGGGKLTYGWDFRVQNIPCPSKQAPTFPIGDGSSGSLGESGQ